MDTVRMLRLTEFDASRIIPLVTNSEQFINIVVCFNEIMERSFIRSQIINVFDHYELGTVTDVYEIFGGYVNRSFGVYTERDGKKYEYFVRMYKKGITKKEIQLEHSLIDYSIVNGLDIAAGLIRTKDVKTFVKTTDRYFAVYDFLHGEDKYTWDNPTLNDEEYASAAEVLATFHNASKNFDPEERTRVEPKIIELLPLLPEIFKDFSRQEKNTKFHKYYLNNLDEILAVIERTRIPVEAISKMIVNPIHSDFHPGNLKFKDNRVVGIFDFDWSKIDLRLFDLSLALVYCCCSWQDELDGVLLLDKCQIFLKSYQRTLQALGGISPLNEEEIEFLPTMMAAANLYLINWDVSAYYNGKDLNVYEYLAYLQHNIRLMRWIESHKEDIYQLAKST